MESGPAVRFAYNILFSAMWTWMTRLIVFIHCFLLIPAEANLGYIIVEGLCLLWYLADTTLAIIFFTPRVFFGINKSGLKQKFQFFLILLFLADYGVLLYNFIVPPPKKLVKFFQCMRAAMFLIKVKTILHIFQVVGKTFVLIIWTVFAIILFIVLFSCIGVHLFGDIYHDGNDGNDGNEGSQGAFDNVGYGFIQMFVLLTTENYPDFMIKAYEESRLYSLYFIIYLYTGVFIALSILLAIVVDNYWTIAKQNVKHDRLRGRKQLGVAWTLLGNGETTISVYDENLQKVMKLLKPENDGEEIILLLQHLASNANRYSMFAC